MQRRTRGWLWRAVILGGALAWLTVLVGWASPVLAQQGDPSDTPQGAAYRGQRLFAEHCLQCHGAGGKGDGPMSAQSPVPLADFTQAAFVETRSPQAVFDFISNGNLDNLMPPWKDSLSQAEIWDLTAYVWSLHLSEADLSGGAAAYGENCASCHGAEGEGGSEGPALGSADGLSTTETEWWGLQSASTHPAVAGADGANRTLAATFGRSFSLGFTIQQAIVQGNGVLSIRAQNGTTGVALAQAAVQLLVFDGQDLAAQRQARTDAEGVARFEGLPTDPAWAYVASADYNGIPFESDMLQFEPSQAALEAPLMVYETGATAADIRIGRAHWVISLQDGQNLDVGELYAFDNTSDRVYMGETQADGAPAVLRFAVPEGATNVSFEGGELGLRFQRAGEEYVDTMPLPPGGRQVLIRYSLPIRDGSSRLSHTIPYPVANLNLLAPDAGMAIAAPDWLQQDPLETQGGNYLNYLQSDLAANSSPEVIFSNIDAAQFASSGSAASGPQQVIDPTAAPGVSGLAWLPILLAVVSAGLLGGGAYLLLKRQQAQAATLPALRQQQQQALIQEIADLDDAYDAGELVEADYQARRRLLKAQFVSLRREEAG
ncbi:MAG: c-type cytochrome [Caldilineales bacterium]|nr:c-type cytochrome [Caldilineales bacterium]MCW5857647.1 c-type cytochrome [Caldilineales bacterium]